MVPIYLVAIATIAVGAALVIRSVNLVQEFARLFSQPKAPAGLGGGSAWSIELLAGVAGIVLGILALLSVDSVDLVAIAAIAYGSGLLMNGNAGSRLALTKIEAAYNDEGTRRLASEIVSSSAASQALTGLGAIVLGILALAGFSSVILVLIALLALGAVILLNGAALGDTVLAMFGRSYEEVYEHVGKASPAE